MTERCCAETEPPEDSGLERRESISDGIGGTHLWPASTTIIYPFQCPGIPNLAELPNPLNQLRFPELCIWGWPKNPVAIMLPRRTREDSGVQWKS